MGGVVEKVKKYIKAHDIIIVRKRDDVISALERDMPVMKVELKLR